MEKKDMLKFFAPFSKVSGEGTDCVVEGYMTTDSMDSQEEEVELQASFDAVEDWKKWGNIREMHGPSAAGVALQVEKHAGKGIYLVAEVVDPVAKEKCRKGVYKGFSIGGKIIERAGRKIVKYRMLEVSLVDRPANPDCLLMVAKADYDADVSKQETTGDKMEETKPENHPAEAAQEVVSKAAAEMPAPPPEMIAKAEYEQVKTEFEKAQARITELEKSISTSQAKTQELEKAVEGFKKEKELKEMLAKAISELQPELKKKYEEMPKPDQKQMRDDAIKKMSIGQITAEMLKQ